MLKTQKNVCTSVHVSAHSAICKYMSWFTPTDRATHCVTSSGQSAVHIAGH